MFSAANSDNHMPTSVDQRRLQRALNHVSSLWFPVNPEVLAKVKNSLADGRYDLGMEFLVEDLKTDLALYTFCIREVALILRKEGVSFNLSDPVEFLELAGVERVRAALNIEAQAISRHSAEGMTHFQARQVETSLISASTAQVLADGSEVAPDCAYLTATLRQLGLTLISWNYPSVFQRAIEAQSPDKDLDTALSEKLGFSPLLLAIAVAKEWGLAPEVRLALGDDVPSQERARDEVSESAEFLTKLCHAGEALARANQPDIYPSAAADWATVKNEIFTALGPDALKLIQKHVREYCSGYSKQHRELFEHMQELNPEHNIHVFSERSLIQSNIHLENCAPLLRMKFKEFYAEHSHLNNIRESLSLLFKNIFPLMEFSGALVYTIDNLSQMLTPRLKVGAIQLRELKPVPVAELKLDHDSVAGAFQCAAPLSGHSQGQRVSYMACRLGGERAAPIGVLYVEVSTDLLNSPQSSHVLNFKALRQALEDLLSLK